MDKFEHYKDSYHKENERTKGHMESLSLPLGIITVLGTIITYYLSNFDYQYDHRLKVVFLIIISLGGLFLLVAIAYLWSAFHITWVKHDWAYYYLPPLDIQEQYYNGLVSFYAAPEFESQDRKSLVNKEFCKYLEDTYITDAANNIRINDKTAEYIYKGKRYIFLSMACLMFTLAPFGINYALKPDKPTLIEIKKSVTSPISNNEKITKMPKQNNVPPQSPPPPKVNSVGVPYPTRPESTHVKNGEVINPYPKVRRGE